MGVDLSKVRGLFMKDSEGIIHRSPTSSAQSYCSVPTEKAVARTWAELKTQLELPGAKVCQCLNFAPSPAGWGQLYQYLESYRALVKLSQALNAAQDDVLSGALSPVSALMLVNALVDFDNLVGFRFFRGVSSKDVSLIFERLLGLLFKSFTRESFEVLLAASEIETYTPYWSLSGKVKILEASFKEEPMVCFLYNSAPYSWHFEKLSKLSARKLVDHISGEESKSLLEALLGFSNALNFPGTSLARLQELLIMALHPADGKSVVKLHLVPAQVFHARNKAFPVPAGDFEVSLEQLEIAAVLYKDNEGLSYCEIWSNAQALSL